jgi:hypothetical protein
MAMAFVNSYSFSHRFSDDREVAGFSSWQEIVHQSNAGDSLALVRDFYGFALGCGHAPQTIVDVFIQLAEEYSQAHCGYDKKKDNEQC